MSQDSREYLYDLITATVILAIWT